MKYALSLAHRLLAAEGCSSARESLDTAFAWKAQQLLATVSENTAARYVIPTYP